MKTSSQLIRSTSKKKNDLRSNIHRMNISLLESIKSYSRLQEIKKMSLNEGVSKERISILLENEKQKFQEAANESLETAADNLDILESIGKKLNDNETIKNTVKDLRSKLSKINLKGGLQAAFDNFAGITVKQLTYINSGIASLAGNIKAALTVIKTQFKILKIGSSSNDVEKTVEDHISESDEKNVSLEKIKGAIKGKMSDVSKTGAVGVLNRVSNFFTGSKPALIDTDKFASELIGCKVSQINDVLNNNLDEVDESAETSQEGTKDVVDASGLSNDEIADTEKEPKDEPKDDSKKIIKATERIKELDALFQKINTREEFEDIITHIVSQMEEVPEKIRAKSLRDLAAAVYLESKNSKFISSSKLRKILKESTLVDLYKTSMNNRQNTKKILSIDKGEKMRITESHLRRIIREEVSRTSRRKPLKEMSGGGLEFDQLHDELIPKIQRMIMDRNISFVEVAKNASGFGGYEKFTAIDDDSWIGALEDAIGKGDRPYIAGTDRGILSIGLVNASPASFADKMARGHYG